MDKPGEHPEAQSRRWSLLNSRRLAMFWGAVAVAALARYFEGRIGPAAGLALMLAAGALLLGGLAMSAHAFYVEVIKPGGGWLSRKT